MDWLDFDYSLSHDNEGELHQTRIAQRFLAELGRLSGLSPYLWRGAQCNNRSAPGRESCDFVTKPSPSAP
jgi:hypothetical protein